MINRDEEEEGRDLILSQTSQARRMEGEERLNGSSGQAVNRPNEISLNLDHYGHNASNMDGSMAQNSPPSYSTIPGTVPLYGSRSNGPPPSYDEVINPDVPPPSYQSLFGQVREARKTANGLLDFLKKVIIILLGTLGFTIILGFTVFIPFTMILMGASYMDECRAENIPSFLLIGGIVWVLKNLLNFWNNCRGGRINELEANADLRSRQKRHESLLNCFLFGWFVTGCIMVYRIYPPDYYEKSSLNYCDRTLYLFTFWLVTSTFIIFILFMTCLCCLTIATVPMWIHNEPQ